MITFPTVAAARESLAEAERRLARAQARLDTLDAEAATLDASKSPRPATLDALTKIIGRRDSLPRERREAQAERAAAMTTRDGAKRRLDLALQHVDHAALETRCAEAAAKIASDYRPAATAIAALMATSHRLQAVLEKARKQAGAGVPRLPALLTSEDFCATLRLPIIWPDSAKGYLWYPSSPAQIDAIEAEDAVPLGAVRVEAFAGGDEEADRAARAAKAAAQAIVGAYEDHARTIIALFDIERELSPAIQQMSVRGAELTGVPPILFPAQRLGSGRIRLLARAVCLPSATGRGAPLWSPNS